jgi:hypothetical protein
MGEVPPCTGPSGILTVDLIVLPEEQLESCILAGKKCSYL